jgi:hypothetical protein
VVAVGFLNGNVAVELGGELFGIVTGNVSSDIRSLPRSLKHSPFYPLELIAFYVLTIRSLQRCVL